MNLQQIIKECGEITTSKGFDCSQHLKQLLLIADEVDEALEHILVDRTDTDMILKMYHNNFHTNINEFHRMRKECNFEEKSRIIDAEKLVEEMADICIRVFSYCAFNDLNLADAIEQKMQKNRNRGVMHGNKF